MSNEDTIPQRWLQICTKCGVEKAIDEFYAAYLTNYNFVCKECCKPSRKRYYKENPEYFKRYQQQWYKTHPEQKVAIDSKAGKKYRESQRQTALEHYGAKCACCGETETAFLTFDHINGNGGEERRVTKKFFSPALVQKLSYPNTIQLLCANCHLAKDMKGACPHQVKVSQ